MPSDPPRSNAWHELNAERENCAHTLTSATTPVTGALCVSTCAMLQGSVADGLARRNAGDDRLVLIEHPSGMIDVALKTSGTGAAMQVISGGVIRTARKLMQGEVFVPGGLTDG